MVQECPYCHSGFMDWFCIGGIQNVQKRLISNNFQQFLKHLFSRNNSGHEWCYKWWTGYLCNW